MLNKILSSIMPFFLLLSSVQAEDCILNIDSLLPALVVPEINLKIDENSFFCFDESSIENPEAIEIFKKLKNKNVFDSSHCLVKKKISNEMQPDVANLFLKTSKTNLNVYSPDSVYASDAAILVMTNSKNKHFLSRAFISSKEQMDSNQLTTKDTLQIAGATVASSLVGIITARNIKSFKNEDGSLQHDKLLHANYGALINIGSVGGAYLIVETAGLGDKLNLTKNQKKWTILLTGTVVGMLAGYGKERLYDYKRQGSHTYDPKLKGDMGATWLGAGILNPLAGAISFQF